MSDGDDEDSKISENHIDPKGSGNVEGNNVDNSQQPEGPVEPGGNNLNISQKPGTSEDDNKGINNQPEKSDGGIVDNSRLPKPKSNSKGSGGSVRDNSRLRKAAKSRQYDRDKDTFFEWKETRYYNNPAHPNAQEGLHLLPNFMADHQRNIRLAMMLSVNMKELPTMDPEQLLIVWADNLIGYFGPGVAWENFSAWLQSKHPCALEEGRASWVWEEIAGRMFFFDLFDLLEDRKLSNQTRKMYEGLFMNLLRCIWGRLNNEATWDEKEARVGRMTGTCFSTSYELNPSSTHFLNGRTDAHAPFYAEWVLPAPERTNLAFHSYGVISCDPKKIPNPLPPFLQYVNYEIRTGWKNRLTEGLNDWFTFVTLWGSLDCSTQRRNDNNRWGTDRYLVIPDTPEAIQRFVDDGYGPESKKEKEDDDDDSKISRGDDDEGNHTPEKDKDFSETLHGDNTSGAGRHRSEPEAERSRFSKSSSSNQKPPPKNDWSFQTPGLRFESREDDKIRTPKTPHPNDIYSNAYSKAYVVSGKPSSSTEQVRLEASKQVTLPDLKFETVRKWERHVKDYEKYHGAWNRETIDPEVKDLINYRWSRNLFDACLPYQIRTERETGQKPRNWQWLDPGYITTEELADYLRSGISKGKSTGQDMGHEEFNAWIRTIHIDFSMVQLQDTWESFITKVPVRIERLLNQQSLEVTHHLSMCNEIHKWIETCRHKTTNLCVPIYNAFRLALVTDTKKDIHRTLQMIDAGYDRAMTEVVRNNIHNTELFSRATAGRDERDKDRGESKDSNPSHREKEKVRFEPTGSDQKRGRLRSPSPKPKSSSSSNNHQEQGTGKAKSQSSKSTRPDNSEICPGCGRWITKDHTTSTCNWIVDKKKGYNEKWETVPWKQSRAYHDRKDKE
jgi:hypothetical protein